MSRKKSNLKPRQIRLTDATFKGIAKAAAENQRSISGQFEIICREWLAKREETK